MFAHNDNSGMMFTNSKQNEKQPDYTGSFSMGGVSYRIAAWKRQGAKGEFLSFKISDFEKKHIEGKPEIKQDYKKVEINESGDDGLPF